MYGAEVMLLNLMEEQIKLGMAPVIASIGEKNIPEKPVETEAVQRGLHVEKFRMTPGPNVLGAYAILKYAKINRFDIIHSHGYKGNILLGFIPKKLRKIPMISTLHGYTSTSGLTKMRVYEWMDLFSHRFIDHVVIVNKGMLTNPKLKNQKIKYHIINNGIPTNPTNPINPSNTTNPSNSTNPSNPSNSTNSTNPSNPDIEDFCKGHFTIGTIGRLSKEKGYEYLIKALSIIRQKNVNAKLVIIGEGKERKHLEALVKAYELSDHVLIPGYRKNANQYMPYFSVYAISSLTEGLPITLLETMFARIPVIATTVGGIPDVLEHEESGIMVEPCNPEAICHAVTQLFEDIKLREKLATSAYEKVVSAYSSRQMALNYLTLYKSSLCD
ncbi:MAG: glycosyltransferase [Proteobacteria bacterium]|nr:glycosyltransferase [Pseudomonadota bacterium]